MQTLSSITWDELKSQYYHNLRNFQDSIEVANNSTVELFRIYSQVMKKSNNSSPEVLQNFKNSWVKQIKAKNSNYSSVVRHDINKFLKAPNPSTSDFNDFQSALQQKMLQKSFGLMADYQLAMKTFYDTWLKFWSN